MSNWGFCMVGLSVLLPCTVAGCGDSDKKASSGVALSGVACASQWSPCGGDVVGTWVIDDFCLASTSEALRSSTQSVVDAVIQEPECADATLDNEPIYDVSGTYVFAADGSGHQDVTIELGVPLTLSGACLDALLSQAVSADQAVCDQLAAQLIGLFNAASKSALPTTTCTFEASACQCVVHSLPQVSQTDGQYSLTSDSFISPDGDTFDYCVSDEGTILRLNTPETAYARGTMLLRRQ